VGVIENLHMKLAACPDIEMSMDVLVIDVPDVWGMLLSREWAAKLGGHIQMDLTYATIPRGPGKDITLLNEPPMKEHVETPDYLYEEAIRPTTEVRNFMVLANY
jgi:hypothetical protein